MRISDWSSDVCSSDLASSFARQYDAVANGLNECAGLPAYLFRTLPWTVTRSPQPKAVRSGGKIVANGLPRHTTDHDLGVMAGPPRALRFHHFCRAGFGRGQFERVPTGPEPKPDPEGAK